VRVDPCPLRVISDVAASWTQTPPISAPIILETNIRERLSVVITHDKTGGQGPRGTVAVPLLYFRNRTMI
jgi:hypothetical protein